MTPSHELASAFQHWFRTPKWVRGGIGHGDALFLLAMMEREKPKNVIEIGVAAGVSSAVMLWWLEGKDGHLLSTDIRDTCYFDNKTPVGAAVGDMLKSFSTWWTLVKPMTPIRPYEFAQRAPFDFAFIDGSHLHPDTTNDVIGLLPYMAHASWIVLHDIRLIDLYPSVTPLADYGPQILFEHWAGDKIDGGENIGAIQLYDGCEEELRMIREIPTKERP